MSHQVLTFVCKEIMGTVANRHDTPLTLQAEIYTARKAELGGRKNLERARHDAERRRVSIANPVAYLGRCAHPTVVEALQERDTPASTSM